jgi:hypothetical protein
MSKFMKLLISLFAFALVAACGGESDSNRPATITYLDFAGYRWSSTTEEIVIWPSGFLVTLEKDASSYCSQQTCEVDKYGASVNCRATNFNNETGWNLPNRDQLQALYNANPSPQGWVIGPIWSSTGGSSLDFRNGEWTNSYYENTRKAHVTCIKRI